MSHPIIGTPQLEAEDGLKVFAFQKDSAFQSVAKIYGRCERGLCDNIVDAGGEYET